MSGESRRRRDDRTQVVLRLPVALHRTLTRAAATDGVSFNTYCVRRLAEPPPPDGAAAGALGAHVVGAARTVCGDQLRGVVVTGSWARGQAVEGSDLDVLVVLDPAVPLTRTLYRTWDAAAPAVPGRPLAVHFTHPHVPGTSPGAVWCEAAIDGLVWFDRDGEIAASLADVRRAIAHGRVVRAVVHGQPYWKAVA